MALSIGAIISSAIKGVHNSDKRDELLAQEERKLDLQERTVATGEKTAEASIASQKIIDQIRQDMKGINERIASLQAEGSEWDVGLKEETFKDKLTQSRDITRAGTAAADVAVGTAGAKITAANQEVVINNLLAETSRLNNKLKKMEVTKRYDTDQLDVLLKETAVAAGQRAEALGEATFKDAIALSEQTVKRGEQAIELGGDLIETSGIDLAIKRLEALGTPEALERKERLEKIKLEIAEIGLETTKTKQGFLLESLQAEFDTLITNKTLAEFGASPEMLKLKKFQAKSGTASSIIKAQKEKIELEFYSKFTKEHRTSQRVVKIGRDPNVMTVLQHWAIPSIESGDPEKGVKLALAESVKAIRDEKARETHVSLTFDRLASIIKWGEAAGVGAGFAEGAAPSTGIDPGRRINTWDPMQFLGFIQNDSEEAYANDRNSIIRAAVSLGQALGLTLKEIQDKTGLEPESTKAEVRASRQEGIGRRGRDAEITAPSLPKDRRGRVSRQRPGGVVNQQERVPAENIGL